MKPPPLYMFDGFGKLLLSEYLIQTLLCAFAVLSHIGGETDGATGLTHFGDHVNQSIHLSGGIAGDQTYVGYLGVPDKVQHLGIVGSLGQLGAQQLLVVSSLDVGCVVAHELQHVAHHIGILDGAGNAKHAVPVEGLIFGLVRIPQGVLHSRIVQW